MADIRLEVERYYQGKLWLARDFMRFEISDKGHGSCPFLGLYFASKLLPTQCLAN